MTTGIGKIVCARLHGTPDPPGPPLTPFGYGWFGHMWIIPVGDHLWRRLDPGARVDYRLRRVAFEIADAALSSGLWKWVD